MRVAFDAVMLSAYLHPEAKYPKPVEKIPERIQLLVDELEAAGAKIIIPTPVLSEFLVLAKADGPLYLADLTNNGVFDLPPFDVRAAIEAADTQRRAHDANDKKSGAAGRWQVVKVDRQFVAIAKVNGVDCIYSDDDDVRKLAAFCGIPVKGVEDLPTPPEPDQPVLSFPEPGVGETIKPSPSTEPPPPSSQSPDDEQETTSTPEPDLPSAPPDDQV